MQRHLQKGSSGPIFIGVILGFTISFLGVEIPWLSLFSYSVLILSVVFGLKWSTDWLNKVIPDSMFHYETLHEEYDPTIRVATRRYARENRSLNMKKILLTTLALSSAALLCQNMLWTLPSMTLIALAFIGLSVCVRFELRTPEWEESEYYPITTGFRDIADSENFLKLGFLIGDKDSIEELEELYLEADEIAQNPNHPDSGLAQKWLQRRAEPNAKRIRISSFIDYLTSDQIRELGSDQCQYNEKEEECQWKRGDA